MSDFKTPYQQESVAAVLSSLWRQYAPVRIRND